MNSINSTPHFGNVFIPQGQKIPTLPRSSRQIHSLAYQNFNEEGHIISNLSNSEETALTQRLHKMGVEGYKLIPNERLTLLSLYQAYLRIKASKQ